MSDDVSFDVVSFPVVSTAIDSRLELGVDVKSELRLKTMILGETKVLFDAFFGPLTVSHIGFVDFKCYSKFHRHIYIIHCSLLLMFVFLNMLHLQTTYHWIQYFLCHFLLK